MTTEAEQGNLLNFGVVVECKELSMLNTIQYLSVPRVCLKCTQSVSGSSDQVGLSHLGPSVTISENIGPFLTIQDHLCPQGTISDISDHLGPSLNQSQKNPVGVSALLTGKFLRVSTKLA